MHSRELNKRTLKYFLYLLIDQNICFPNHSQRAVRIYLQSDHLTFRHCLPLWRDCEHHFSAAVSLHSGAHFDPKSINPVSLHLFFYCHVRCTLHKTQNIDLERKGGNNKSHNQTHSTAQAKI